ncbi:TPA: prepilin-type N-terminal cleavage/methylation domain-containing protein [Candidatus Poribacteria bacterium]|nr:prepilin-type N-terminal cleavage/methylation domain-containing protein [Candidatus Poribacteria bacterium]
MRLYNKTNIKRQYISSNKGFTLIEIMVAVAISMMIIGSVYAVFKSSLNAYQKDETRIIMLQKCRTTLDRIAQDVTNMFYASDDEELVFLCGDNADPETNMDMDMVSFVTVVNPNLRDYVPQEESKTSNTSSDEEETENNLPSDLARVVYFIGQNPETDEPLMSLMRVETTKLDTQNLQDMLEQMQSSTRSSQSEEVQELLKSSVLMDNVAGLNIRYFDGSDWADTWDMEEEQQLPQALEITLSVTDPDNKGTPLTQAIVVYLNFSTPVGQQSGGQNTAGQGNQMTSTQR